MPILLLALKTKSFWFAYRYKFIQAKIYFIIAQFCNTGGLQAYEHIISIATKVYMMKHSAQHTHTLSSYTLQFFFILLLLFQIAKPHKKSHTF